MRNLTKDEMMSISGGLDLFDTTAWTLGMATDLVSKVFVGGTVASIVAVLKRVEAFMDGRL